MRLPLTFRFPLHRFEALMGYFLEITEWPTMITLCDEGPYLLLFALRILCEKVKKKKRKKS